MKTELKKFESDLERVIEKNNATFEWKGFIHTNKDTPREVKKVAFALDLSIRTLTEAIKNEADVLLCFHAPNQFEETDVSHKNMEGLLRRGNISVYKCHLPINFSPVGLHYQACKMLQVEFTPERFTLDDQTIDGGVYRIKGSYSIEEITSRLKVLNPFLIKIFNSVPDRIYSKILFSSGSGCKKEMLSQLSCDLFISGEIKHGAVIKAEDMNITLIEIGHYFSESEPLKIFSKHFEKNTLYETFFIDAAPREKIL